MMEHTVPMEITFFGCGAMTVRPSGDLGFKWVPFWKCS